MSSWGLAQCTEGNMTNLQRRVLPDLNFPPTQNRDLNEFARGLFCFENSQEFQVETHQWFTYQTANNVEVLDDEVTIISPHTFTEAIEFKRVRRMHEELDQALGNRRHAAETNMCRNYPSGLHGSIHLKAETSNKKWQAANVPMPQEPPQPPAEPIFSCPICLGNLNEPTTTKCGHIFCKDCILRSMKSLQSKCPTCRQKVGKRSIFRVYLPTTN